MATINNFDPVAWSIDGGRHRGELLRSVAYALSGGREGVVTSSDARPHALSTPGPAVQIDPGAIVVRNASSNVIDQSYVVNNRALSQVDIDPAGGSARSDLICVRVKDPQYPPYQGVVGANDPATFQYVEPFVIKGVPATTTTWAQLNRGDSGFAIARVDLTAGTTNITAAMIKDLRGVVNPAHDPREARTVRIWNPTGTETLTTKTPYMWFPKVNELITCPAWASRLSVIVTMNGLIFHGSQCWGSIRPEYGYGPNDSGAHLDGEATGFSHEDASQVDDKRQTLQIAMSVAVPTSFRGKSHYVRCGGVLDAAASAGSFVKWDKWSTVVIDAQFEEVAD